MAGAPSYQAFTGTDGYACDFLPYRRSNAYFRTFAAVRPEDWTNNTALTSKADDTIRYVEIAASSQATWLPSFSGDNVEVLGGFLMRPGQYTKPTLAINSNYEVRIDTTAGTVTVWSGGASQASASLPASVWTSASAFNDCWVRTHLQIVSGSGIWFGAKVWSATEAEPVGYTVIWNPFNTGTLIHVLTTDPPGIGSTAVAAVSACRWFSYGVASPAPTPRIASDAVYFDKWMKAAHTQGGRRIVTVELFIPGQMAGPNRSTAVLRVATEGYNSGNAWPFSNQVFPEGLLAFPSFTRELPDGLYGRQKFTVSELSITNANGMNDNWLRAVAINAVVAIRYGDPTWPWYDLAPLFTGVVTDITEAGDTASTLRVNVKDAMERFNIPVATALIGGTSVNAGKPMPISVGTVFNVSPVLTDSTTLTYAVGSGPITGVSEVRDKGVALTTTAVAVLESYDATANTLRTVAAHLLSVGDAITLPATGLPAPLVSSQTVFVASIPSAREITVSATLGGAVIDLVGVSALTIAAGFPSAKILRFSAPHNLIAGDSVVCDFSLGELIAGVRCYVLAAGLTSTDLSLSLTPGGVALALYAYPDATITAVDTVNDRLSLSVAHGLNSFNAIVIEGSALPSPLVTMTLYSVYDVPSTTQIRVASTSFALIDLTTVATGGKVNSNPYAGLTARKFIGGSIVGPAYTVDVGQALIRLRTNPSGQLTADVQGQKYSGNPSAVAGNALRVIAAQGDPIISTVIGTGTTLAKNVGMWFAEPAVLADQIDLLAQSCASIWSTNRIGTLVATAYDAGSGYTYTTTISNDDLRGQPVMGSHRLPADYYNGLRIAYKSNYTVQRDADLAGSVSTANRALYAAANSTYVRPMGSVVSLIPTQNLPEVKTALVASMDAAALLDGIANASGNFYMVNLAVTVNWIGLDQFQCGKRIRFKTSRYGFDATTGTSCIVRAVTFNTADGSAALSLWAATPTYVPITT